MFSPLIQHLLVTSTANFGPRGNPKPVVQYSYYVGEHGPFTDQFDKGTDTVEAVQKAMQANIDKLVALGAVAAQS
jgi:hypothetical protein